MIHNKETVSKDDLITLLNLTDDHISYVDKEYVYRAVNEKYVTKFKLPIEQIIGKKVWEILGVDVFETVIKPKMEKAFLGETITYESWFDFESAEKVYLLAKYTPIWDDSGEISGVAVTATDITARKKLEEERATYQKILLDRERTAQLGDMLAMIAHEWRTPLHALSTYLLRLYENEGEQKDAILQRCEELIGTLSATIDEVNSFYYAKKIETVPLTTHINHALALFRHRMKRENVALDLNVDERCTYKNHGSLLVHLFVIFIENGLDALSVCVQNDSRISIFARCDSDGLIIEISDNGHGIPEVLKEKVFEPGFSTKGTHGNGYGLYIAQKIVCDHLKGELSLIESEIGTRFRIKFPLT